jgi:hypothetical protein
MQIEKHQLAKALNLVLADTPEAWEAGYYDRLMADCIGSQNYHYPVFDYEYKDRRILYTHVHNAVIRSGPMDFFEFGVFRGESFRTWMEINTHPASRFFGFDSFEGLPEEWRSNNLPKGHFSTNGALPDIDDSRGTFITGYFNKSLYPFLTGYERKNRMVIHIDSDLCSSCLYVLMAMNPWIARGTVIVFDDFGPADEFAAFHHWYTACSRTWKIIGARADLVKFAVVVTN